ncbi:hypothetical protein [Parvibaculum sp.]|uniref:hypothetical protein n=1 Tax=Parvibaculum sp. TaxID=2024848 RepID=UPI0027345C56|nr:hypothetical protein [Parvibaculum sp.]MDP3329399.1 hypothetical protein [Parvibaculum sp.]
MSERQISALLEAENAATTDAAQLASVDEATREIRDAFIVTMRDLAASKREAKALQAKGPNELEPYAAFVLREHTNRLFAAVSALLVDMRLYEAQAVLSCIDMIVDLSRDEGFRDELAARLNLYESTLADMRRQTSPLSAEELRMARSVARILRSREERLEREAHK